MHIQIIFIFIVFILFYSFILERSTSTFLLISCNFHLIKMKKLSVIKLLIRRTYVELCFGARHPTVIVIGCGDEVTRITIAVGGVYCTIVDDLR